MPSQSVTTSQACSLSLASALFPGFNESPRTVISDVEKEHTILLAPDVAPSDSAASFVARCELWCTGAENTSRRNDVCALHVCITDTLNAAALVRLRALFPCARLLTNFGVGLNHIDLEAARAGGFQVTNTPGVLTDATADTALLLLLMVSRRATEAWGVMNKTGRYEGWAPVDTRMGVSLAGKTLGIVGLGRIGRAFAERAQAMGMNVVALASMRDALSDSKAAVASALASAPVNDNERPIERLTEDEFLARADVVSLHCPLTPETRGWLSAKRLATLCKGAIVLNTARGEVVDESALAAALASGHLFGAGIDVFQGEPVLAPVLATAPNLTVLPHIGSATWETRRAMGALNRTALVDFLGTKMMS